VRIRLITFFCIFCFFFIHRLGNFTHLPAVNLSFRLSVTVSYVYVEFSVFFDFLLTHYLRTVFVCSDMKYPIPLHYRF
jgi:hypothetical protein